MENRGPRWSLHHSQFSTILNSQFFFAPLIWPSPIFSPSLRWGRRRSIILIEPTARALRLNIRSRDRNFPELLLHHPPRLLFTFPILDDDHHFLHRGGGGAQHSEDGIE